MIALGLLLALFTFLPSAQDSAEGLPSVQPVDYVSLMDSHSYDYLSHGNHQCDMYSDSRDAAIEEAKVYCSSHSDCGGFAISQFWESFCPQFFSLNPTTYDNSAWTFFVKSEEVVTSMEAVQFMTSDSGDNCDNACEAIGEECIEDMLFLQSAEEVASWALEVGVACREILDRCDIGESPIFLEDGVCTFCSNPNHPGWDNGNRCGAQWHIRQRICPCTSTLAESKSTVTPEGSTTELPDAGFTFRLRGDMGTESVTINDGGLSETIVLSQEWTEFVAFSSTIAIEFTNDDGFDRENIDFESNFETNIIAQQQWSNWDCDSDNENLRCQIVRNGRFAWYATYLITFGEEITDYGFVQGGLCGENWTDMMRGAIELSRNNEEPAKDPMECAKLTAENSECGSYFVQRNDYHVCWCMSKQGVHADCSIRDDWQIHSSGNSYGSIYKLFASSTSIPTTDPTFEPTINPTLTPTANPSDIPSGSPTSTTSMDGLVRGWPMPVGSPLRKEWYKCNNCGWLPSSVGGVVQRIPQNDLGLTWHEACAWWCEQEPECVSAWHRISGNHCSLYNFTLPFAANNHPTSHIYVKPMTNPITTSLPVSTSVSSAPSYAPSLSPITSSPSMHPSIVPSSTPSAQPTNRPSVASTIECAEGYELKQGMPMHGRGCTSGGISCTERISAEQCAAICSDSEHCVAYSKDQGSDKCITIDTSFYYRFGVHTRGFHQGEGRTYCEKAQTTMRPFNPEAKFTTSQPGQSCTDACKSIEEECRADMLFLQSAEEVASWALAVGVTCTSIVEKCSHAVAPLFNWSHPKFTNNELVCTFCSEPEPEWKYGTVCNARFASFTRICPCSSTTDLPTIQPSVSPTLAGYEGSMCNVDDDCDSERCNFGEFPSRCREKENHSNECNRDGDCESDLCLGRKCVDGRDNDRCHSNDDCQSGRCAYGIPFGNCQAPAEHGENCIRNNDCASQHCLLSTCTDHRDGAHCANDDDCLEGSSCVWSKTGATCEKNYGCTWWNWNECSEKCSWFQKVTSTCY